MFLLFIYLVYNMYIINIIAVKMSFVYFLSKSKEVTYSQSVDVATFELIEKTNFCNCLWIVTQEWTCAISNKI